MVDVISEQHFEKTTQTNKTISVVRKKRLIVPAVTQLYAILLLLLRSLLMLPGERLVIP